MDVYSLCQHFKFLHSWVNTIPGYYGVCRSDSGSSIGLFFFFFSNSLYPAPANPWWPHVKFHHKRKDSVIISPTSCFYLEKIISPWSIFVGFSKTFHSGQNCFLSLLSHTKGGTQLWYNEVIEDCHFFCGGCSWLGTNHLHLSSRWKQTRIYFSLFTAALNCQRDASSLPPALSSFNVGSLTYIRPTSLQLTSLFIL